MKLLKDSQPGMRQIESAPIEETKIKLRALQVKAIAVCVPELLLILYCSISLLLLTDIAGNGLGKEIWAPFIWALLLQLTALSIGLATYFWIHFRTTPQTSEPSILASTLYFCLLIGVLAPLYILIDSTGGGLESYLSPLFSLSVPVVFVFTSSKVQKFSYVLLAIVAFYFLVPDRDIQIIPYEQNAFWYQLSQGIAICLGAIVTLIVEKLNNGKVDSDSNRVPNEPGEG